MRRVPLTGMPTLDDALARARSMLGKKTKYKLSAGGMFPDAASPVNVDGECDCSGFISWVLRMSRKTDHPAYLKFNGGWINTDAIVHDAGHDVGFFSRIDLPRAGALVVYPARKKNGKTIVGHVGIITSVALTARSASSIAVPGTRRKGMPSRKRTTPFSKPTRNRSTPGSPASN